MKNLPKKPVILPYIDLPAVREREFGPNFGRAAFHELKTGSMASHGHAHANIEANFLESGAFTYLLGGRLQRLKAGEFGIFWAAFPHQVSSVEPGTSLLWLTVPVDAFLSWKLSTALYRRLFRGDLIVDAAKNAGRDLAFFQDHLKKSLPSDLRGSIALLEIHARILWLQAAMRRSGKGETTSNASSLLSPGAIKLAAYIATHFKEPITLGQIAASGGLHPSYAARLFRRTFGVTTGDFLAQSRIAHALALLRTTDAGILDIGLESGFQSSSRFYETFRRITGRTPKDFRKRRK